MCLTSWPVPLAQYGAGISRVVECPRGIVGRVIGKGGETIKALQKHFGANIQIDQSVDPMKITIIGQPSAVATTQQAVEEIVAGGNPFAGLQGMPGMGYGAGMQHLQTCQCLKLSSLQKLQNLEVASLADMGSLCCHIV